jgi:hypothetical protein
MPPKRAKKVKPKRSPTKPKTRIFSTDAAPYNQTLYWCIAPHPEYEKAFERMFGHPPTPLEDVVETQARCEIYCKDGAFTSILWFAEPPDPSILAHELFHFVYWLLSDRGIPLTKDTNEVYAYLLESLVDRVHGSIQHPDQVQVIPNV